MELCSHGVFFKLASRSSNSDLERTSVVTGVYKVIPATSLWGLSCFLCLPFFPPCFFQKVQPHGQAWGCLCNSQELVGFPFAFEAVPAGGSGRAAQGGERAHPTRTHSAGSGQPLIPAQHTCLLGARLCVTCWPYRNLTYEDYPETELQ